jgi:hypothetical protein
VTVAALLISIIAILVSIASVWYTRRAAVAAEQTARIDASDASDADYWHAQLAPEIEGQYVSADSTRSGVWPAIRLTNKRPFDLDRVDVETVPAHRSQRVVKGFYDYGTDGPVHSQSTGPMRLAESWTLEVVPELDEEGNDRGGTLTLRCTCHASGHPPWTSTVDVEFPHTPVL